MSADSLTLLQCSPAGGGRGGERQDQPALFSGFLVRLAPGVKVEEVGGGDGGERKFLQCIIKKKKKKVV